MMKTAATVAMSALALFAQPALARRHPKPPEPLGDRTQWFGVYDYPPAAMRGEEEGRVSALLSIDDRGLVTDCKVTQSSGYPILDATTCRLVTLRARFKPAVDKSGHAVAGTYQLTGVDWRLPHESVPPSL